MGVQEERKKREKNKKETCFSDHHFHAYVSVRTYRHARVDKRTHTLLLLRSKPLLRAVSLSHKNNATGGM